QISLWLYSDSWRRAGIAGIRAIMRAPGAKAHVYLDADWGIFDRSDYVLPAENIWAVARIVAALWLSHAGDPCRICDLFSGVVSDTFEGYGSGILFQCGPHGGSQCFIRFGTAKILAGNGTADCTQLTKWALFAGCCHRLLSSRNKGTSTARV